MSTMFSIIVPIYKIKEEYLRQCIESLIGQTFRDIEIQLVDDGSPDCCGSICDEYAEHDSRIKVHHLKNGGLSYARNAGLEAASGKYIVFLDGDDWVNSDFCSNMYDILLKNQAIDIISTCYSYAYQNGQIDVCNNSQEFIGLVELTPENKKKLLMAALYLPQYLNADISTHAEYSVTMWGKVYRHDFLLKNSLKCVLGISPFEDNIFYSQVLNANPKIYFDTHISFNYRINEQSVTQRKLQPEHEIQNLSKTISTLNQYVSDQQLMALFTIMRLRQITENIILSTNLTWVEQKNYLSQLRNDDEIVNQLCCIEKFGFAKQCKKNHLLFYILFKNRYWLLLRYLFAVKKNTTINQTDNNMYIRFK